MNAKNKQILTCCILVTVAFAYGESLRQKVTEGNDHYRQQQYDKALESYSEAIELDPQSAQAAYNKANSLYRQQDYQGAIDAYSQAAAAGDPDLAVKAKYNLGNSFFHKAQTLEKTEEKVDTLEKSIDCWRQVQKMRPEHATAAKNIETARLLIQQAKQEQQQQQQGGQDPNQPSDPNQPPQDQQQQQSEQQNQQQQNQQQQQQSEQNEQEQQDQQAQEQEQTKEEQSEQNAEQQQVEAAQAAADQIIKDEEKNREKRRLILLQQQPVEKDW